MQGRWADAEEVQAAFQRHFVALPAPVVELLTVLAFMYAPTPVDVKAPRMRELRKVSAEFGARIESRRPGLGPDAELVGLTERRNELRDGLLHLREVVERTEARVEDGVQHLPTTVTSSNEGVLLGSRRGSWWARTLFHGVELLRAEGLTRAQALETMNDFAALIGHFPDARRLREARADPERCVPSCDLATRDIDLLLEQYKQEKKRRRRCGESPTLSRELVIKEACRVRRERIFLYELEEQAD